VLKQWRFIYAASITFREQQLGLNTSSLEAELVESTSTGRFLSPGSNQMFTKIPKQWLNQGAFYCLEVADYN
jgi:hypothetical protein